MKDSVRNEVLLKRPSVEKLEQKQETIEKTKCLNVYRVHRLHASMIPKQEREALTVEVWHLSSETGWRFSINIIRGRQKYGWLESYNDKQTLKRILLEVQKVLDLKSNQFVLKGSTLPNDFLQKEIFGE